MNKILYVAVDVDDQAFHGYALAEDELEGAQFLSRPCPAHLIQTLRKIQRPGYQIRLCYEAGYLGYSLYRALVKAGFACDVIAPSLIPKPPGTLVKTDRIDAQRLALYYKQGLLTKIHIPDESQEALRDLLRSRHFLRRQAVRVKHHLLGLCRRVGLDYRQQAQNPSAAHWTKTHTSWLLGRLKELENPLVKLNLETLLGRLRLLEEQIHSHDETLRTLALDPKVRPQVQALCCYRGLDVLSALTLVTELGDIRRFDHPRRLTSYAGMDLIEHSSGGKERRFSMSRMGNRHIRTTVIEACQYAFNAPVVSQILLKRRQETPAPLVDIADRCMERLHKKARRLLYRDKPRNKIKAACAREMLAFIWESLNAVTSTTTVRKG
jgi:transposase